MSHVFFVAPFIASLRTPFAFWGISEWWNSLDSIGSIYAGIGLAAGFVSLVLLVLTVLGLDQGGISDALEIDVSADTDVHADGSLFSTRSIAGFFLGFGGGASIAYESTHNAVLSGAIGFAVGISMFFAIYYIAKKLLSLQSDGTVDYEQAVNATGTAYLTIPPNRASGGSAQIVFNNRHELVDAISYADVAIPAGTAIRVKQRIAGKVFLVETL